MSSSLRRQKKKAKKECFTLCDAIANGDVQAFMQYIESCDVDYICDNRNNTLLLSAVQRENLPVVTYLLDNGADTSKKNAFGHTAVYIASKSPSSVDVLGAVLVNTALDVMNDATKNPLWIAVANRNMKAAEQLILAGATPDLSLPTFKGNSSLHMAVFINDYNILKFMLNHTTIKPNLSVQNEYLETPLHQAAKQSHLDCARVLIENGANVNIQDIKGATPLHNSIIGGNLQLVTEIIEARADVNAKNNRYRTPLHLTAAAGYPEILLRMVEAGADINAIDVDGFTPLHDATINANHDCVEALIKAGANINIRDKHGSSPYYYAVIGKSKQTVGVYIILCFDEAMQSLSHIDTIKMKYYANQKKDTKCGLGRLKQYIQTCWFNAVLNMIILSTKLSNVLLPFIREIASKYSDVERKAILDRFLSRCASWNDIVASNSFDVVFLMLHAVINDVMIIEDTKDVLGDMAKVAKVYYARTITQDPLYTYDAIENGGEYGHPQFFLTSLLMYLQHNSNLQTSMFIGTFSQFNAFQLSNKFKVVVILPDNNANFNLHEHKEIKKYTLDSAILTTETHVICAFTCHNQQYLYDSNMRYLLHFDWIDNLKVCEELGCIKCIAAVYIS